MQFSGSFVPLLTPFDRKGRIDQKTLQKLIEWHISEGTDGLVCCASTGEGASLDEKERKKIAEICIRTSSGKIPVIVSTGTNDTKTSIRFTEAAQKLGANGCLVVTPYYNKPTQKGCLLHFSEIAKVALPVILYHNPARAVIRLQFETLLELSKVPNIVALKDSGYDLELIEKISNYIPVFSGDDDIAFQTLQRGGIGTICTVTNLIPRSWKKMVSFALEKKWDEAQALALRYSGLIQTLFLETNPQGQKFALSWLGRCQPILRLPMILPERATQTAIKQALIRLALPQFNKRQILK